MNILLYIHRADEKKEGTDGVAHPNSNDHDYMILLETEVDKFFNQDGELEDQPEQPPSIPKENVTNTGNKSPVCQNNKIVQDENSEKPCKIQNGSAQIIPPISTCPSTVPNFTVPVTSGLTSDSHSIQSNFDQFDQSELPLGQPAFTYKDTQTSVSHTVDSFPKVNKKTLITSQAPTTTKTADDQRPNEITKKIFKALTEKILKNKINQHLNANCSDAGTSASGDVNGFIQDSLDLTTKLTTFTVKHEGFLNELNVDGENVDNTPPLSRTTAVTGSVSQPAITVQTETTVLSKDPVPINMTSTAGLFPQDPRSVSVVPSLPTNMQCQSNMQAITPIRQNSYPAAAQSGMYYNNMNNYIYPLGISPNGNQYVDRDIMLERYIQQQQEQFYHDHHLHQQQQPPPPPPQQHNFQYGVSMKENYAMKSPDSGFHEPCLSPTEASSLVRQYYGLTLEYNGDRLTKNQQVKSVIMVIFRDDKSLDDERKAWEFWHSRQHSYKQRVLDVDTKDSQGVMSNSISEVSYNAVAGLPLHIQIDTFENPKDTYPIHRGYCQIKVFCDKGAERKTRDEERRKVARAKCEASQPASIILVRMDDNIIRHYAHESTFMIELNTIGDSNEYEVILTEIDVVDPTLGL
ncbi:hypothetical protein KUTeg_016904 [Tegillarca granosa]|uniref:Grh/CP2 DB domain-containing protein n=1 Tax=Tegillarca granosa TaxID=220873 RepID=A0ABQ9EN57_TEGGR|nr:hypothetical protein KUTeg_016904 [Tegillarca granosa]